jgi:IS30 family transposase
MVQGDGLVQLREIDQILNLEHGATYRMWRKHVFYAIKLKTNILAVQESELAYVIDRILRYRTRRPWYPLENMTVAEAAEALRLTESSIYGLLYRNELETAKNEHWKCATRESVNRLARRKGLGEVA